MKTGPGRIIGEEVWYRVFVLGFSGHIVAAVPEQTAPVKSYQMDLMTLYRAFPMIDL